jgi:hypothetical protein
MVRKYDYISALAQATAQSVVRNETEWAKYLESSSRVYRYPFKDQLLIYAQRPNATACASLEFWNEKMYCWVNKGAKGIALIDDSYDRGKKLRYVFDVSDVHKARRIGKDPNLWKMREEHKEAVLRRLENIYGETNPEKSFEQRIVELSDHIVLDYYGELMPDLKYLVEGSFLEEYDEQNLDIRLWETLSASIPKIFWMKSALIISMSLIRPMSLTSWAMLPLIWQVQSCRKSEKRLLPMKKITKMSGQQKKDLQMV